MKQVNQIPGLRSNSVCIIKYKGHYIPVFQALIAGMENVLIQRKFLLMMSNPNYRILTLIQFIIPIYLFVGLFPIPFWYYASIRWVIMVVCIYLAILSFSSDFPIQGILMICMIFIFRPIYPFIIEGTMWVAFNIAAIILFLLTIYYLKENYKRKEEMKLPDLSNNFNN
jgi:hypothetical protein